MKEVKEKQEKKVEKQKKPSFFKKLKMKVDQFFEESKLTFLGKIFVSSIYCIVGCICAAVCLDVVKIVLVYLSHFIENNYSGDIFSNVFKLTKGLCVSSFIACVTVALVILCVEIARVACDDDSILEVSDER